MLCALSVECYRFLPDSSHRRGSGCVTQVMTHDTTSLTEDMSVREAVELFVTTGLSGFPVFDAEGRISGALSLADILWHEAMEDIIEQERVRARASLPRRHC